MADILPECLIQKILCFLSFKEATRMSILSKTWLQAWSTLPNLEFTVISWEGDTKSDYSLLVDTIMERYRKGKIPIERFELLEYFADSQEVLPLIDKWLDIALQNGVKNLFLKFTSYPTPILTILAGKSLRELVLWGCTLTPFSLSRGVVNCNSLRKLSLSYVTLDENMLDTLFNSCPLIVSFILEYCSGLTMTLRKIKSDSLKVLKIHHLYGIEEIDAPNLVSLDYVANQIPELKIARESSQLKHSKIALQCMSNNAAWFCKLKKLLSNSSSWSRVTLQFFNCTEISMTDLQMDHIDLYDKPIESISSSFVEVTVGHEGDKARMIDQHLDEHESELDVISIVGMPGLSRTTLANKVYNNTLVASHFNVCAWCIISQKYNKSKVSWEILQKVTGSEGKESEDDFAEKLRRALLDKRYLIVLVNVWDIATGEMLIACFPKVKRGNRIILTSRSSKVGLQVKCRSDPLDLQLLTPEKRRDLF
ncbi:hypothetical protein KY285_036673 [Solanum tuberosum]|nr:hypothetical protein KY285_036673 [Solanum tuberosum]